MVNKKHLTIAEAKAIAGGWDAEWKRHCYDVAVADHFRDASASQLVSMWESHTNEKGQSLSQFEFEALCTAWLQVFGCLPPDDDAGAGTADTQAAPPEPEPADDTMLRMSDVVRLTGVSESTIKRMVLDGRFPKPMHLSPSRIGWPARDVKAWLRQLDDQRRASRHNAASLPLWQAAGAALLDVDVNSYDLPIRRSERAGAPFPLEITGAGPADTMRVVLRDVPEAASLSNGERQDEHTWLLRPADLDNLRLSMREGTPDAFNVTIEVAAETGDAAARSIARVRLLDAPARPEPPAAVPDTPALPTTGEAADARLAPQSTQISARTRPAEAAPQQKSPPKPPIVQVPKPQLQVAIRPTSRPATRPEGMSALGMASREPETDARQLWWRMPAPSWAGFTDLPGGN